MSPPPLADALRDRFVVVNLGAGGDAELALPDHVRRSVTLVQIDAANAPVDESSVHRRVPLRRVVADAHGTRTFHEAAYPWCSSLVPPRPGLVRRYGLEDYFETVASTEVECFTLPEALAEAGVAEIDFLGTDVEGLDAPILRTSSELLARALVVRSELRFEPMYEGEPPFHEAVALMEERGFELVGVDPEAWKPATPRQRRHRDGRTVWADCVFVRRSDALPDAPADLSGLVEAKQVLLTAMTGLRAWAEHLLERNSGAIPADWHADLWRATAPVPGGRVRERAADLAVRLRRRVPPRPRFDLRHVV